MNIASILLAAGGSTRLGSPKQLLVYQGRSLLRRAADAALAVPCAPLVVMLGARAEAFRLELADAGVHLVENPIWERGMGGSVRRGMEALPRLTQQIGQASPDGVLLMLCDQPLVDATALRRLVDAFTASVDPMNTIAAAAYQDTVGVPALFGRGFFDKLCTLPEEAGAKPLLRRHAARVVAVPMPEAAVDIDTREQYAQLIKA